MINIKPKTYNEIVRMKKCYILTQYFSNITEDVITTGIKEYLYIMAVVSVSLGITNLLPIPALDGGKILLLLIEAIRRKPVSDKVQIQLQLLGFSLLIALSIFCNCSLVFIKLSEIFLSQFESEISVP